MSSFASNTRYPHASPHGAPTRSKRQAEDGKPASLRGINSAIDHVHGKDQKGYGGSEGTRATDGQSKDNFGIESASTDKFGKNSGQFNDRATSGWGGNEGSQMGPKGADVTDHYDGESGFEDRSKSKSNFSHSAHGHNTSDPGATFHPGEHTGRAETREGAKRSNFGPTRRFSNRIV